MSARPLYNARVMPWCSWREWNVLRQALSRGDFNLAASMLSVYRLRRRVSLPLATQATHSLVTLLSSSCGLPVYTRRLALALALTRLVNGLTDRLQPRGPNSRARSVHELAVELGFPSFCVELRHQACHNELPGLDALSSAARAALVWLGTHYWENQKNAVEDAVKVMPQLADFRIVFQPDGGLNAMRRKGYFDCEATIVADGIKRAREKERAKDREKTKRAARGTGVGPAKYSATSAVSMVDGEDALQGMKKLLDRLERKRSREREQTRNNDSRGNVDESFVEGDKKRRWRNCGNEEMWRLMPLGLAPGQTEVCNAFEQFFEDNEDEVDGIEELRSEVDVEEAQEDLVALIEEAQPVAKRRRVLQPEERDHIRRTKERFAQGAAAFVAEISAAAKI